jgi:RND superfamily putative drug exporter
MAGLLERLGRTCAQHRHLVLGAWLVALVGLAFAASSLGTRTSDDLSLPGTGSQSAGEILEREFPAQQDVSSPVVFAVAEGSIASEANRKAIEATLDRLRDIPHVVSVVSPFSKEGATGVSRRGRVAYSTVTLDVEPVELKQATADAVADTAHARGLDVAVGGLIGQQASAPEATDSDGIGLVAAVLILLLTFGSVVAMGLPIVTALLGLGAGLTLVTVLGHVIAVPTIAPTLATMIGLGVGIDYALFLITRHRGHLADGVGVEDSIARTNGTSGAAVVFAGGTVIIALCSLALARIPIVSALGYTAAIVVAVAVLAAVTLLPALLAVLGTKINALPLPRQKRRAAAGAAAAGEGRSHGWARWGEAVARRPVPALVAGLVLLLALAAPALHLNLGQADASTSPKGTEARTAFDLLAEGFGPGSNGPLLVAIDLGGTGAQAAPALERLDGALEKADGVASVSPPIPSRDGSAALITVTPTTAPGARATEELVSRLRRDTIAPAVEGTALKAYVGGQTAGYVDLANRISERLPQVILTVIALSFLLLLVAFRSIVLPIKAAVMNLLSIGAAYGVVTAVFQDGWGNGLVGLHETVPIVSFVPLMMFAILFGLSMDYEVFLLSQVQEHWQESRDARQAVIDGIATTGRVITAAACIMVCVFGSFVLNADPTIKQFGLGMAVAVAVDATLVRCLLVPAVMVLLGRRSWWLPAWLDRLLPHMDIEGGPPPRPAPLPPRS